MLFKIIITLFFIHIYAILSDIIDKELIYSINEIDKLYNDTEDVLTKNINIIDQMLQAKRFWIEYTRSDTKARERAFGAHVALLLTKQLLRRKLPFELNEQVFEKLQSVCVSAADVDDCENSAAYRRIDGRCNNVRNSNWGANYGPFKRLLSADYADGVSEPRRSVHIINENSRAPLPNSRLLSNLLFREPNEPMVQVNLLTAHWAMFVFFDIVHIGSTQLHDNLNMIPLPCCTSQGRQYPECLSLFLTRDDPIYRGFVDCMDYSRTVIAPRDGHSCTLGSREQANQATSYLDGSVIYGSTEERANKLRTFTNGFLHTSIGIENSFNELPPTLTLFDRVFSSSQRCVNPLSSECFLSGSPHIKFLPTLTALHALFVRQHNRIAQKLSEMNKKWTDEQLYQEARRIVIAQIQHITYAEFLPLLLGRETWRRYALDSSGVIDSSGMARSGFAFARSAVEPYDIDVDASALNVYACAVGQFFFTMLGDRIAQYSEDGMRTMERPLSTQMYESSPLFNDKIDGVIRFLLRQSAQQPGLRMTTELRDKLFKNTANLGLDLAALILQTGRDHAIPGYTLWRKKCGGSEIHSFDDLANDLNEPERVLPILARHFKHVDDVDLFILGLAEKPLRGGMLGPTFSCLLATQFQRTKRGDRFWYENHLGPWVFSDTQLAQIQKTTLANIICANSEISAVQPLAFHTIDILDNYLVACNSTMIEASDFSAWRDAEAQIQMPVSAEAIRRAMEAGMRANNARQRRERRNIAKYQGKFDSHDPLLAYGKMMRAKAEAIRISRISHILLESTKALMAGDPNIQFSNGNLQHILPKIDITSFLGNIEPFLGENGTIEKCLPRDLPCDHTSPYRTYTGWCNNLRFPHYGNAFGPLRRILHPAYDDGIDTPRSRSKSGSPLPSPRVISNAIHTDEPIFHTRYTHMVMQFGQILDHELTHSPVERGPDDQILNCSRCDSHETLSEHCMPHPVPEGDPFFPTHDAYGERRCFAFARSILGQLSLGYRNQLNQLTAFIDGSAIYGSTQCEAATLRSFQGGRLNFTVLGDFNREALPQGDQEQDCRSTPRFPCFVAGDERNSHQPALTTMHNIFLREHNRIARQLETINPTWDDERIYQETRKIVGALFQHIAFNEYIPKLIGREMANRFDLITSSSGYYFGYDDSCDASISHPFATAAFRFGHTLIRRMFPRMNTFYRNFTEPLDLVQNFNNVEAVYDRNAGGIDTLLLGLLGSKCMAFDRFITTAVRNHLFEIRNVPLSGMDLITLNILRARDHGVPSYNRYREFCGFKSAQSFDDLQDTMDDSTIEALRGVYEHVDDIDLFPGLVSERPLPGALLAPTMSCIIAEQFQRLKKCDRFYYENDIPETRFTPEQLSEIRRISLGSILCQNSKILTKIQPDVFSIPDNLSNAQIPCEDFPRMNFIAWMERPACLIGNDRVPRGASKLKSPCVKCTCTSDGTRCKAVKILNCDNLINNFLMTDIKEDLSCVVQCSTQINRRISQF